MTFNLRTTAAHCSRRATGKPVIGLKAFALPVLTAAAVVGGFTVMTAPAFAETYVVKLGTDKGL